MEQLLTVKEAALALKMHEETLYKLIRAHQGPLVVKYGRKIIIRESAIREFLDRVETV